MNNPENKERPNRSETSPAKRDRSKVAAVLGKAAVAAVAKRK
jgi:hypothetical protein